MAAVTFLMPQANHFPGIYELTYKPTIVALHRNLSAVPKGFLLPDEEAELREQVSTCLLGPGEIHVTPDGHRVIFFLHV